MSTNRRFILTGGPGTGKTTVLDLLAADGLQCVPEVARSIIRERVEAGLSPRPDPKTFAELIFAADCAQFDAVAQDDGLVFFDRGIADALGMLYECGAITLDAALEELKHRSYNSTVLFFPAWESIYVADTERDQSFAESIAVSERIRMWYTSLGFSLVVVPTAPPRERVDFILATIA